VAHAPSIDFAAFFAEQTGHALGEDVFHGRLPDDPSEAIAFLEQGGLAPSNVFDGSGPRQPTLQVMVRADATDYVRSREIVQSVFDTLHCQANLIANGRFYLSVDAQQEPIWLGYDNNERPMWSINFQLMFLPFDPDFRSRHIDAGGGVTGAMTVDYHPSATVMVASGLGADLHVQGPIEE
jgi:hypothetical protein